MRHSAGSLFQVTALVVGSMFMAAPVGAQTPVYTQQQGGRCLPYPYCPPSAAPATSDSDADPDQRAIDPDALAPRNVPMNLPPANARRNLADFRTAGGPSASPNMIGDFFGTGGTTYGRAIIDTFTVQLHNAATSHADFNGFDIFGGDVTNSDNWPYKGQAHPFTVVGDSSSGPVIVRSFQTGGIVGGAPHLETSFTTVRSEDYVAQRLEGSLNYTTVGPIFASPIGPETFLIQDNLLIHDAVHQIAQNLHGTFHGTAASEMVSAGSTATADGHVGGLEIGPIVIGQANMDWEATWTYDYFITVAVPGGNLAATPGANVGRMKLIENTSPIPRDRVYVNYSYFNDTPLAPGGVNVHRVTPGFEKTFLDGNMSFELRTPFATTLDSNVTNAPGLTNTNSAEFGNLTMFLKALLWDNDQIALSAGLGVAVPTASDFELRAVDGTRLVSVKNESVHLLPFIGAVYTPTNRLFLQSVLQFDVDVNGNPVSVNALDGTGSMSRIGRPNDRTYAFFSANVGYWVYLSSDSNQLITGIAPMAEYHLNQSLDNGSTTRGVVNGLPWQFAAPGNLTVNNAVLGVTAILYNEGTLTLGYATPLQSNDRQFDGELRLMFNWLFGSSRPNTRAMRASTF